MHLDLVHICGYLVLNLKFLQRKLFWTALMRLWIHTPHNWNSSYNNFVFAGFCTQFHKLERKVGKHAGSEFEAGLGVKRNESQICPLSIEGFRLMWHKWCLPSLGALHYSSTSLEHLAGKALPASIINIQV